jgi:peptide/nickel transport system substrate-binding protein
MFHISRWKRPTIASSVALAVLALVAALTSQAIAAGKTITAVMHSDLRIIDPGFTTAYITRDHGYIL